VTTTVTLHRFDEVRDAYRQKDLEQALYDEGGLIMADVLLTLHGAPHRDRRRLENRLFRRETFAHFEKDVMPSTIERTLAPFVEAGRADLVTIGHRTTMNLTADIAGIDRPEQSPAETEALYRIARKFGEGATVVHTTRPKEVVRAEVADALVEFDERFFRPSYERRRALLDRGDGHPADVLTTLIENVDRLDLSYEMMRREVAFYLQAGSHSTANAFTHTLDDLWRWAGTDRDRLAKLHNLAFVQRGAHETLRLHPASPVGWRRALAPVTLRNGMRIDTSALVVLDLEQANRDTAVFGDDAADYNPVRTVPLGIMPWGHSFGGGIHACIGAELDGGVAWFPGTDPATHLYGTVAIMAAAVLRAGGRPDPDDPPRLDPSSTRPHFGRYSVRFR
jgi:cytochrome P450